MSKARRLPLKTLGIFFLAATIGVVGGLLGVGFLALLSFLQSLWSNPDQAISEAAAGLPPWLRLLIPAAGGLLAGLVLLSIKNQRGPFGIADSMELIITRKGRIRPLHSLAHILSSALSIGSGGSIGKEGANSQLGATVGEVLSRSLGVSARTRSVLLGCGIAAGMAAAYKAPIAGALFVMEVVLGSFAMDVMAPIVVASVLSSLVTKALIENTAVLGTWTPIFSSKVTMEEDWKLVLSAVLLGAICGIGGIMFRKSLTGGTYLFQKIPLPLAIKMALGGLVVGLIGIGWPEVWGNGQSTIKELISGGKQAFLPLALILIFKIIATSASTGSGGLGGVFTPNLVVGAFFGAAFAAVLGNVLSVSPDNHEGFKLVGMAGLCAATTHAPITAIILIFEMTGDYGLILPLMLCAITASITSRLIDEDSIYSERLRARGHGHRLEHGIEELAMHGTYVRDVMRKDQVHVLETAGFDEILDIFNSTRRDTIYVTDSELNLIGHIQLHDIKYYLNDGTLGSVVIAADLTRATPTSTPDDTLAAIIVRFDDPDLDEMPVVSAGDRPLLEGRLTRRDLMTCLSEEVLGKRNLRAKLKAKQDTEATYVELPEGSCLARLRIPDDYVGRAVDTLDFHASEGLVIMFLIRVDDQGLEQRFLPDPQTLIEPKMSMVVIGKRGDIEAFEQVHGLTQ